MKPIYIVIISLSACKLLAQGNLPFREIPDYPETYTAEMVVARMVEGLGVRYYWATEGLRSVDLAYSPGEGSRSTRETLEHIYGLTQMVLNSMKNDENFGDDPSTWSFEELRHKTLGNIAEASQILRTPDANLKNYKLIYGSGDDRVELPFWLQINGPIEDAVWHVGQVVSFRRSSGNPFPSDISLFSGKLRK